MAKILVVDDTMFMRVLIRNAMEKGGHKVVGEAANGREAVEMYSKLLPDVVTLDLTMPVMDGLAALRVIRALDRHARVIVCSAMGQQELIVEALQAGACEFVVKPFPEAQLVQTVSRVMEQKKGLA